MNEPVFIKIDDYKKLKTNLDKLDERIRNTRAKIDEINKIKEEEQELFDSWEKLLSSLDEKIKKANDLVSKE
jgi:peptidoglycan hydrolase CwlO-like protein